MIGTLTTIGYASKARDAEQFLQEQLALHTNTLLVDTRFSPQCRWSALWRRSELSARYGSRYVWKGETLGNRHFRDPEQPIELADETAGIAWIVEQLTQGVSLILLCACADYERCHRKVIFEKVKAHLGHQLPATALEEYTMAPNQTTSKTTLGTSSIEWTDATWNPLTGCTRVTTGCEHCYAFTLHDQRHAAYLAHEGRYPNGRPIPKQYALPFTAIQLFPERLDQPLRVKQPKRIFVNSMGDLFHSTVPDDYIMRVFEVMRRAHWHTFQVLTKRAGRLRRFGPSLDWPPNVWMGVSIEQDDLTPRADALRTVPAAVKFLSCEPLLGPLPSLNLEGIDWVITGGESGRDARPCQPQWVRDLRDRCLHAHVAFFHKQWGGRTPKAGGRELDGRTWEEYPLSPARQHVCAWSPSSRSFLSLHQRPATKKRAGLFLSADIQEGQHDHDSPKSNLTSILQCGRD